MGASLFDCQYPKGLRDQEERLITARRLQADTSDKQRPSRPHVGLAFSGGGIRSATFCLGVLQALANKDTPNKHIGLRDIDILSTVSGGGYIGSFFGAMFCRDKPTPGEGEQGPADVEQQLNNPRSSAVNWLRENGRYLAPNGAGDEWLDFATILRNWVALAAVMSVLVMAVLMIGQWMEGFVRDWNADWIRELGLFAWQFSGIYWSPFLGVFLAVVLFLAIPLGWAYWLGRLQLRKAEYLWVWLLTIALTLGGFYVGYRLSSVGWMIFGVIGTETLAVALLLTRFANGAAQGSTASRRFRNLTSRWLTSAVILAAAVLGLAFMDTLGRTAYMNIEAVRGSKFVLSTSFMSAIGVLLTTVRKLATALTSDDQKKHITISLGLVGGIAGIVATALLLCALSTVSYTIARTCTAASPADCGTKSVDESPVPPPVATQVDTAVVALLVLTFLLGRSFPFVNLSSLSQFYSARLSRTYIGASNEQRQRDGKTTTEEVPGDDLELSKYKPYERGGPLHLINVTLNETVGGSSQVLDRDRKGLAMAIGPVGVSVGVTHHATWSDDTKAIVPLPAPDGSDLRYRIWPNVDAIKPKQLSLSQWTAISGAAASTGMGAQTSLGLSLLLGMANVRLGYWWDSKAKPGDQHGTKPSHLQRFYEWLLPVQSALTDEFLAQFRGPHRRYWYLTDGGHFENTASYELLRRRVPIIIICDDGADSDYSFEDLANLVRKARLDFDADVQFVAPPPGFANVIGTFDDLKPSSPFIDAPNRPDRNEMSFDLGLKLSRHHLLIATITYPDHEQPGSSLLPRLEGPPRRARSLLIVLKPSLTGDEPLDLLQYAESNPSFPQQTTADQFFDEAQWESYRRLGQHVGGHLTALDFDDLVKQMDVRTSPLRT